MITIFCSLKLSKLINIQVRQESISLNNWNGDLFSIDGRKCIVFVHKETLYSFVLLNILKKDLSDFGNVFLNGFIQQLEKDNILTELLKERIVAEYADLQISTTDGDKSTIGFMNDCISRFRWNRNSTIPVMKQVQKHINSFYNKNPLGTRNYKTGIELMLEKYKNESL